MRRVKLILRKHTIRNLATAKLDQVVGGAIDQSQDGQVCESVTGCPSTVVPYPCTAGCQTHRAPCYTEFGPCA